MKIVILGYSGSGKSTLARAFAQKYGLKIIHLDSIRFMEGWKERSFEEMSAIVGKFMDENENWVIDGNFSNVLYDRRLLEADLIVELLFNRFTCLFRVYKRYRKYKNKTRPDMAEGCTEKLDKEFISWILHDGRQKKQKTRYKKVKEKYGDKVVVIKNQRGLSKFTKNIDKMKLPD